MRNFLTQSSKYKVNVHFNSVKQGFENYNDLSKTLARTSYKKEHESKKLNNSNYAKWFIWNSKRQNINDDQNKYNILKNFIGQKIE